MAGEEVAMRRWVTIGLALAVAAPLAFLAVWRLGDRAQAQPPTIEVKEVRGQPVIVNGQELRLWVFVQPAHNGPAAPGGGTPAYCTDGAQSTTVPKFANANPNGLVFKINRDSIPIDKDLATQGIRDSFAAWDAVNTSSPYFTINNTGGASGPAFDGNNTVGWAFIVPTYVLAATWTWTDTNNNVVQTDVFYNSFQKWGVFTTCNGQSSYEVGDIGTHEIGHTVGLNHLSDPNAYATMYPTASKGEVRKRTLTAGDAAGYTGAGGY